MTERADGRCSLLVNLPWNLFPTIGHLHRLFTIIAGRDEQQECSVKQKNKDEGSISADFHPCQHNGHNGIYQGRA